MQGLNANVKCCEPKKDYSVIEGQIYELSNRVDYIKRQSVEIMNIIGGGFIQEPMKACNDSGPRTIAGLLNEITSEADESHSNLNAILEMLQRQLGDLKLEY